MVIIALILRYGVFQTELSASYPNTLPSPYILIYISIDTMGMGGWGWGSEGKKQGERKYRTNK